MENSSEIVATVLGINPRQVAGTIEEVRGKKILVRLASEVAPGAAIRFDWGPNTVLAEVQAQLRDRAEPVYMLDAVHLISRAEEPLPEARPSPPAPDFRALECLLAGIRGSAVKLSPALPEFEKAIERLEQKIVTCPSPVQALSIAQAAVSSLSRYNDGVREQLLAQLNSLRLASHLASVAVTQIREAEMNEVKNESLRSLEMTLAEFANKLG